MSGPVFKPPEREYNPAKITTRSIVSHRTGRGVVVIEWNREGGQFDPEDARQFAHTLLRECDNAETDAFLYSHFKDFLNDSQLAVLISEYRRHRAELEQRAGLRKLGRDEIPEEDRR
jgi:hypothetical protein